MPSSQELTPCLYQIAAGAILISHIQCVPKNVIFRMLREPQCTRSITSRRHPSALELDKLVSGNVFWSCPWENFALNFAAPPSMGFFPPRAKNRPRLKVAIPASSLLHLEAFLCLSNSFAYLQLACLSLVLPHGPRPNDLKGLADHNLALNMFKAVRQMKFWCCPLASSRFHKKTKSFFCTQTCTIK